jgi:hypothetical protein
MRQLHRSKLQLQELMSAATIVFMFCCASAAANAAGSPLVGKPISKARAELIKQGWQPAVPTQASKEVEKESDASAAALRQAGFPETQSCTGTGLNYCWLKYRRKSQCLSVQTQGERDPKIHRVSTECSQE